MDFEVLGWPDDGPTLALDWERFSYAGKFVMTNTGKVAVWADNEVVGAVAFNADRTDDRTAWLRYITVRVDRRGEGIGSRLAAFAAEIIRERGFETVAIAVNNPYAYEAMYKAGFGFTGRETGIAELVLERPADRDPSTYRDGLRRFASRDLSAGETRFLARKRRRGTPPDPLKDMG